VEKPHDAGVYASMKRLILFSGGVESTALLALKSPEDIALTIEDISPNNQSQTFNGDAVHKISKAMNVRLDICKYSIPYRDQYIPHYVDDNWYHQLWTFLPIVSIYLTKDYSVSEIWIGTGLNDDMAKEREKKRYSQLLTGWNALHPTIPIVLPLSNLTEKQIWNIIPDYVKPLVRNCFHNNNCGQCPKCIKLKNLTGSCLNSTAV
jgi:7-cyano-7-deazaguanine synthase in queuosine biosynthesis